MSAALPMVETCRVCYAIATPRRAARFCAGCGTALRGVSVKVSPEVLFIDPSATAQQSVQIEVLNLGQLPIAVESIVFSISGHEIPTGINDARIIDGDRAERSYAYTLPSGIGGGTGQFIVNMSGRIQSTANLHIIELPEFRVEADEKDDGLAVVLLAADPKVSTTTSFGQVVPSKTDSWSGDLKLRVLVRGGLPINLRSASAIVDGTKFSVVDGPIAVSGTREFMAKITVDAAATVAAANSRMPGQLTIRVEGHDSDIVLPFKVMCRRMAKLQASPDSVHRALMKVGNGFKVIHGMGRQLEFQVEIHNVGTLDVELAGPVTATHSSVRIRNAGNQTQKKLPSRSGMATEGVKVDVLLQVDDSAFDEFSANDPSKAAGGRTLSLSLRVPFRDSANADSEVLVQEVFVRDIVIERAALDPAAKLFIDFGTTNTCVAYQAGHEETRMLDVDRKDALGNLYPTLVYFQDFESLESDYRSACRFGGVQRELMNVDIQAFLGTATEFKPHIGAKPERFRTYLDRGSRVREVSAQQAASVFLRFILDELKRSELPSLPQRVYLSYPVGFSSAEKQILIDTTRRAFGWEGVDISAYTSEPSALLVVLLRGKDAKHKVAPGEKKTVAVFDFGGGTTDISVAEVNCDDDGELSVKTLGQKMFSLGGELLTRKLAVALWPSVKAKLIASDKKLQEPAYRALLDGLVPPEKPEGVSSLQKAEQELFRSLLILAEASKIKYAMLTAAADGRPGSGVSDVINFTVEPTGATALVPNLQLAHLFDRQVFERTVDLFVSPMFDHLLEMEQNLCVRSGLGLIECVYLAGNSSRLSRVQFLAEQRFSDRAAFAGDTYAKEGVVLGLAIAVQDDMPPLDLNNHLASAGDITPSHAFRVAGKVYFNDQPCIHKFTTMSLITIHAVDAFGIPREELVASFKLAPALETGLAAEKLQITLRLVNTNFSLDVAEADDIDPRTGAVRRWRTRKVLLPA